MKSEKEIADRIAEYKESINPNSKILDMRLAEINLRSRVAELSWVLDKKT